MEGFFSSAPLRPAVDLEDEGVSRFAQAIAGRFNSSDRPLFTARLTPTTAHPPEETPSTLLTQLRPAFGPSDKRMPPPSSTPATPLARLSIKAMSPRPVASTSAFSESPTSAGPGDFTVATAASLPDILRTPHVLILDIRPHSAYSSARLPHAISLSVPSTLLKRPAFTLQKLTTMLSSTTARSRFSSWSKASRILVYDADSVALHDGSNLLGLLRKFRSEGFMGDISWLQGGIQGLWRDQRHLVDEGPVSDDEDETESPRFLRARDLPLSAFQSSSTTSIHSLRTQPSISPSSAFFGSTGLARNLSLSSQHSLASSSRTPSSRLVAANPFYDNIRQNIELSQGITDRIPLRLSPTVAARVSELPFSWLRNIAASAGQDEGTDALARQFYRIELGEQRRMQGVMAHHSMQSDRVEDPRDIKKEDEENDVKRPAAFPFSIIAGVEKGTKNRYRNIWPFEHARVRLESQASDDYVNASFVQPIGTRRRYIATQGPLPSTFTDFWTIVWEQHVRVIVMMTKQYEGSDIKCGKYWSDGQYGPFSLKCISRTGAAEEEEPGGLDRGAGGGEFFNLPALEEKGAVKHGRFAVEDELNNHTICRTFELKHTGLPEKEPRIITQLQYMGWPDMIVPRSPKGLLRFMNQVDELVDQTNDDPDSETDEKRMNPALLHCSAGVGRTGAFIVIDAVLDGVRREMRKRAEAAKRKSDSSFSRSSQSERQAPDAMDVDAGSVSREHSVAPPAPESSVYSSPSPKSSSTTPMLSLSSSARELKSSLLVRSQSGPLATLQMSAEKLSGNEIHVPVVPSTVLPAQLKTPKSYASGDLPASVDTSTGTTQQNAQFRQGQTRPPIAHSVSIGNQRRKLLKSDFTVADADSMFTSPMPNPAFAMDIETLQPPSQQFSGSSSSGEGSMSGGDMTSSSSAAGSASSGRLSRPMQSALGKLSSSDDLPGPTDRSDSDQFVPNASVPRARTESGNGSGSGEGSVVTSGASNSGGYSSTSSLNFRFAGLRGPVSSSGSGTKSSDTTASRGPSRPQPQPQQAAMQKPSLLAPKPVHPSQSTTPQALKGPDKRTHPAAAVPLRLRSEKHISTSSVKSPSSTSVLSSTTSSSTESTASSLFSSTPAETSVSEAPLSHLIEGESRPSSPDLPKGSPPEKSLLDGTAFDYTAPRKLHGDDSPPPLSSLEEPIRQILEDMREQRMSLCQSLRQYVFVHSAIIEGALQIVDEERKRVGLDSFDFAEDTSIFPILGDAELTTQLTGKRGASPTELPKEDKKGDVALLKRPSIKRGKSTSTSGAESSSST